MSFSIRETNINGQLTPLQDEREEFLLYKDDENQGQHTPLQDERDLFILEPKQVKDERDIILSEEKENTSVRWNAQRETIKVSLFIIFPVCLFS